MQLFSLILSEYHFPVLYSELYAICLWTETASEENVDDGSIVPDIALESNLLFYAGISEGIPQQHFLYSGAFNFWRLSGNVFSKERAIEKANNLDAVSDFWNSELFLYTGGCYLGGTLPACISGSLSGEHIGTLEKDKRKQVYWKRDSGIGTLFVPVADRAIDSFPE